MFFQGWFTRVWTFQEAVLPLNVEFRCGNLTINLSQLAPLAKRMLDTSLSGSVDAMTDSVDDQMRRIQGGMHRLRMVQAARNQRTPFPKPIFLDLLFDSWKWNCSNLSDHIYGLLGLADSDLQEQMPVDYTKTFTEVYLDFFACWIVRDPHLRILSMTCCSDSILGIPSFCPDFSQLSTASLLVPHAPAAKYQAGVRGNKAAHARMSGGDNKLLIDGFHIDEVVEVLPCPWERNTNITRVSKSVSIAQSLIWERKCLKLSQRVFKTPNEIPDAHWRTLIANKRVDGSAYYGNGRHSYHVLRKILSSLTETEVPLLSDEVALTEQSFATDQLLEAQAFGEAFGYASHGRSFFTTLYGRVGLGPLHTEAGDSICIFHGAYIPFVVRPVARRSRNASYHLIGESYVNGIMNGEAFTAKNRGSDQTFTLV